MKSIFSQLKCKCGQKYQLNFGQSQHWRRRESKVVPPCSFMTWGTVSVTDKNLWSWWNQNHICPNIQILPHPILSLKPLIHHCRLFTSNSQHSFVLYILYKNWRNHFFLLFCVLRCSSDWMASQKWQFFKCVQCTCVFLHFCVLRCSSDFFTGWLAKNGNISNVATSFKHLVISLPYNLHQICPRFWLDFQLLDFFMYLDFKWKHI